MIATTTRRMAARGGKSARDRSETVYCTATQSKSMVPMVRKEKESKLLFRSLVLRRKTMEKASTRLSTSAQPSTKASTSLASTVNMAAATREMSGIQDHQVACGARATAESKAASSMAMRAKASGQELASSA